MTGLLLEGNVSVACGVLGCNLERDWSKRKKGALAPEKEREHLIFVLCFSECLWTQPEVLFVFIEKLSQII